MLGVTLEVRRGIFQARVFWQRLLGITVGHDEEMVRNYIINQIQNNRRKENDSQGKLFPDGKISQMK